MSLSLLMPFQNLKWPVIYIYYQLAYFERQTEWQGDGCKNAREFWAYLEFAYSHPACKCNRWFIWPGSKVSRGGFLQDRLIQFRICQQPL